MRTLQLTHKEVELIQQALGMAEKKFFSLHEKIANETINVTGNVNKGRLEEVNHLFEKANEFYDLNTKITNSEKDV